MCAIPAIVAAPASAQNDAESGDVEATPIVTDADLRRLEEQRRRLEVLSGLFERQTRVFRVSYRLLYAAVDMCPARARPAVGFTYANAFMFQGAVRTAATAMGYTHRVSVVDVAANSAAARAGVRPRDELIAIGDWTVPFGEGAVTLAQAKLRDVLVRDSQTVLTLSRGAGNFAVPIKPDYLCDIQVLAVPGDPIRAYADGEKVIVFQGLHEAVEDDDVFAAAIAREIANNLIPELDIDADTGVDWASFFDWGLEPEPTGDVMADQSLAQDYGNAADYVGAYLLARAGFDHRKAPDLWRRMAAPEAAPPQYSYGAPDPDYLLGLDQTVLEIDRKLAAKAPLRPEPAGPPTALAAAPLPAGRPALEPAAEPEAITAADTTPIAAEPVDSAAPAEAVSPVEVGDLPWLSQAVDASDAPEQAAPEITVADVEPAPTPAAETPVEVGDLPWLTQAVGSSDKPEPAAPEITAADVEPAPMPAAETPAEIAPTARAAAEIATRLPESESPAAALAAVGAGPPAPASQEDPPAAAAAADVAPAAPNVDLSAPAPSIDGPMLDVPPFDVVALDPSPPAAPARPDTPLPAAETTAQIPASEAPTAALAALGPEPVAGTDGDAALAATPRPPRRPVMTPATGEAEIAVLFRNRPTDDTRAAAPEIPALAAVKGEDEPAVAPEPTAASEPSAIAVEPTPAAEDEFDIGDLILELEAAEQDASSKLAPPETEPVPDADLPWLSEAKNAPPAAPDPGVVVAVGPALKIERTDLTAAPQPDPTPEARDETTRGEIIVSAVEPNLAAPLPTEPAIVPTPAPDPIAAPAGALPAPPAPDDKLAAAPVTDSETVSVESLLDLVAPAAAPSAPGADPDDLDDGFSFRAWLGGGG